MSNTSQEKQLKARIEKLKAEISSLKKRKKYGLVWEDKKEDVVTQCETHVPVLSEVKSKKISDSDRKSENIIIDGDNYHALSVLSYTHRNAIDVIYIDPPYNTGNKDFIYDDYVIDKDDAFKHSKWLSFIARRLKLGKKLLKNNGVIFVSIDDNEFAQLKLLADEVFGDQNYIGTFIWHKKVTGGYDNKHINTKHEYIYAYAKNKNSLVFNFDIVQSKYKEVDKYGNKFKWDSLWNIGGLTYSKSLDYAIRAPDGANVYPPGERGRSFWLWSKRKVDKNIEELKFKKNKDDEWRVYKKVYASGAIVPSSLLNKDIVKSNTYSSREIKDMFDNIKIFDYPKPTPLIKYLLSKSINKNGCILDFFAGSGTTGQATLELNKEDGGNRQFILCTNNENKIAEEVTYPRIKKVIKGYADTNGLGGALRYYKTKLVDIEKLQKIPDERRLKLTYQAGEMIALREGVLDEVEKNDWWQIFESNNKTVAIYFQEDKQKLRKLINKIDSGKAIILYVFSWGKNEYKNEFAEYLNIRVEDIPEPIIEVYKEINRLK